MAGLFMIAGKISLISLGAQEGRPDVSELPPPSLGNTSRVHSEVSVSTETRGKDRTAMLTLRQANPNFIKAQYNPPQLVRKSITTGSAATRLQSLIKAIIYDY